MRKFPRTRFLFLLRALHHFARSSTAGSGQRKPDISILCSFSVQCLLRKTSIHGINCKMSIAYSQRYYRICRRLRALILTVHVILVTLRAIARTRQRQRKIERIANCFLIGHITIANPLKPYRNTLN